MADLAQSNTSQASTLQPNALQPSTWQGNSWQPSSWQANAGQPNGWPESTRQPSTGQPGTGQPNGWQAITWRVAGMAIDQQTLFGLGKWGGAAFGAILAAGLAAAFSPDWRRPVEQPATAPNDGAGSSRTAAIMAQVVARYEELDQDTKRLSDGVTALTADREQFATRLAAVERSLADTTASLSRPAAPTQPSAPPAGPAGPTMSNTILSLLTPTPLSARDQITPNMDGPATVLAVSHPGAARRSAITPGGDAPVPVPDHEASRTKSDIGVDLGSANNFDGLRGLWSTARGMEPFLFEGLVPLVMVRESKTGATDLRLIVGPLPNSDAATRLCVALSVERRFCQPTIFEGHELSMATAERDQDRRTGASAQRKNAPSNQRTAQPPRPPRT
jgi:hypothetical protein